MILMYLHPRRSGTLWEGMKGHRVMLVLRSTGVKGCCHPRLTLRVFRELYLGIVSLGSVVILVNLVWPLTGHVAIQTAIGSEFSGPWSYEQLAALQRADPSLGVVYREVERLVPPVLCAVGTIGVRYLLDWVTCRTCG